jgi:phospholipid/cholesterol/gamma-HCH transport system substrate-binding protein
MSREAERRRETIVGVFVLVALAAATIMVVMLGANQRIFEKRFRVNAIFGTVSGLRAGAPVFVAGVNVGSVDRLRFVPADTYQPTADEPAEAAPKPIGRVGKVEVVMNIEERFHEQIRTDSVATIASVGLLGDKSVEISVGSAQAPVVPPGATLRSQDPLTLTEIIDQIEPIRDKLDKILGDIASVTGNLADDDAPIPRSVQSMSNILEKVDRGEGTIGRLINSPSVEEELKGTLTNAREVLLSAQGAVEQIRLATGELPETMQSVRKAASEIAELSVQLRQSARSFPDIVEDLQVVAENLKTASESFPMLAIETQRGVREATSVFDAAGRTIFLRGYIDQKTSQLPAAMERVDSSIDPSGATGSGQ